MRLLSCIQDSDDRKGLSDPCPQAEPFSFGCVFPQNHSENGTPNKMRLRSIPFYRGVLTAGRISAENIKTIQTKIGDEN